MKCKTTPALSKDTMLGLILWLCRYYFCSVVITVLLSYMWHSLGLHPEIKTHFCYWRHFRKVAIAVWPELFISLLHFMFFVQYLASAAVTHMCTHLQHTVHKKCFYQRIVCWKLHIVQKKSQCEWIVWWYLEKNFFFKGTVGLTDKK